MRFRSLQSFRKTTRTRTTRLVMESLENRTLLAADVLTQDPTPASSALYGDANLDGDFNSMDLVQVLRAGKYETSQTADWSEGDWNLDGAFDRKDIVGALQYGAYTPQSFAAHPGVENEVPFKGSVQEVETTVDFQFPTAFQDGSGSGNATHLGRFTVTFEVEVDVRNFTGFGSAHFIAANGDSIFTDAVGQGTDPAVDPVSHIVETHTITGGTGRFAGATGSFTLDRMLNTVTGVSSGSFDGTIVIHKAK